MQLVPAGTQIDFVSQARFFSRLSVVLVTLTSVFMLVAWRMDWINWGIDFRGGSVIEVKVPEEVGAVDEGRIRQAVAAVGYPGAVIVRIGSAEERAYRINLVVSEEESKNLAARLVSGLSEQLGAPVSPQRIESIGPRVGRELRSRGLGAMLLSWLLILIYIWFRFDLRYAPGAVAALVHDVVITAGVFVMLGLEFNLQVLAALLVVIGYSLNDTIVIYDRIRENLEERGKTHLEDVVNQSINQTLSRTLLTSLTTLIVVMALLFLGGPVLRDFALALLIGVSVGTYSTIYVASVLLILLERRYGSVRSAAGSPTKAKSKTKTKR